jgi:hypothetical protein
MIVFLFTGEARTSPFAHNPSPKSNEIMNSYIKYIFTDEFKSKYKYKIYISTNDIHLSNTINYFDSSNIGNIHLMNTNYYFNPNINKLKPINIFIDRYRKIMKSKPSYTYDKYEKYEGSIHQHYKLLDAYNLLLNDAIIFEQCTLICRIRLDIIVNVNIIELIDKFTNPKCELISNWDIFSIGRKGIMGCYLNVLIKNGFYTNDMKMPENLIIPNYETSSSYCKYRWTYAPEIQLFKMLCEYCNTHNFNIMDAIKPVFDNILNSLDCAYDKEIKILRL